MQLTVNLRSTAMSPSQCNNGQHLGIQKMSLKALGTTLPQTRDISTCNGESGSSKYRISIFFQFLGT